jgi:hypothetical protein
MPVKASRARGGSVASGGEQGLAPRGIDFWPAKRLRRIERRRIDRAQIPQEWNRDVIENAFGRPWRRPGGFEFADARPRALNPLLALRFASHPGLARKLFDRYLTHKPIGGDDDELLASD